MKKLSSLLVFVFALQPLFAQEGRMPFDFYMYDFKMVNPARMALNSVQTFTADYKVARPKVPGYASPMYLSYVFG